MVARRVSAALIALLLATPGLPTPSAAGGVPVLVQGEESPPPARGQSTAATCTLEPGPVQISSSYAWTTPDAFTHLAWRIPRTSCAACAPNFGLEIKAVSFGVRWFGACAATAQVSVVGGTGPSGCQAPDLGHVLYGPATFGIVGFTSTSGVHTLTIPAGWCVGPEAFVVVHFSGLGACYASGFSPGLIAASTACLGCTEYVSTVTSPTLSDWCTLATQSLWIEVEADCCGPVSVGAGPGARPLSLTVLESPSRRVRMRISLAERGPVELNVYDIAGRRVRSLLSAEIDAGERSVDWDGTSDRGDRLPAGVYKVKLSAGSSRAVGTAILLD